MTAKITRSGTQLELLGNEYHPLGLNAYQLATDWGMNGGCGGKIMTNTFTNGIDDGLAAFFSTLPAYTMVRIICSQAMALNINNGSLDWTALDAVFNAAAHYNIFLHCNLTLYNPGPNTSATVAALGTDVTTLTGSQSIATTSSAASFQGGPYYCWVPTTTGYVLISYTSVNSGGFSGCKNLGGTGTIVAGSIWQYTGCDVVAEKPYAWFTGGYNTQVWQGLTNIQWIQAVVNRYKNHAATGIWEIMSEPEIDDAPGGTTSITPFTDPVYGTISSVSKAAAALRGYFDTAGAAIKAIDSVTPISSGLISSGQNGSSGAEYTYVCASAGIDLGSCHDYTSGDAYLPGDQWNGFIVRMKQLAYLNKGMIVGECGMYYSGAQRANYLRGKYAGMVSAGACGMTLWNWEPTYTIASGTATAGSPTLSSQPIVGSTTLADLPAWDGSGTNGTGTYSPGFNPIAAGFTTSGILVCPSYTGEILLFYNGLSTSAFLEVGVYDNRTDQLYTSPGVIRQGTYDIFPTDPIMGILVGQAPNISPTLPEFIRGANFFGSGPFSMFNANGEQALSDFKNQVHGNTVVFNPYWGYWTTVDPMGDSAAAVMAGWTESCMPWPNMGKGYPDSDLISMIVLAKSLGLQVGLKPMIDPAFGLEPFAQIASPANGGNLTHVADSTWTTSTAGALTPGNVPIQPVPTVISAVPGLTHPISGDGTHVTVTMPLGVLAMAVGQSVTITGCSVAGWNGTFTITAILYYQGTDGNWYEQFQIANTTTGTAATAGSFWNNTQFDTQFQNVTDGIVQIGVGTYPNGISGWQVLRFTGYNVSTRTLTGCTQITGNFNTSWGASTAATGQTIIQPGNGWRAAVDPTMADEARFFQSYNNFIAHYAKIAAEYDVDMFCIGCENQALFDNHASQIVNTIGIIKKFYNGPLTYAGYPGDQGLATWGSYLTYVGYDFYPPLVADQYHGTIDVPTLVTGFTTPTAASGGSESWKQILHDYATAQGKPVLLTEFGFENRPGTACANSSLPGQAPLEQAAAMQAVIQELEKAGQSWYAGMWIWGWFDNEDPNNTTAQGDNQEWQRYASTVVESTLWAQPGPANLPESLINTLIGVVRMKIKYMGNSDLREFLASDTLGGIVAAPGVNILFTAAADHIVDTAQPPYATIAAITGPGAIVESGSSGAYVYTWTVTGGGTGQTPAVQVGDIITLTGFLPLAYNTEWVVTAVSGTTITWTSTRTTGIGNSTQTGTGTNSHPVVPAAWWNALLANDPNFTAFTQLPLPAVTSCVPSATGFTIGFASAHGLSVGTPVDPNGFTPSDYNTGLYTVATVPDSTHITIVSPNVNTTVKPSLGAATTMGTVVQGIPISTWDNEYGTPSATVSPQALIPIATVAASTYLLQATDMEQELEFTAACTISIPNDTEQIIPVGSTVSLRQMVAGATMLTVQADSPAAVHSSNGFRSRTQYSTMSLIKRAANDWILAGDSTT